MSETITCANHPNRETLLRCNRCDKPICTDCAVRTPVGFRCRECVRGQRAVYFTAQPLDPLLAGAAAFIVAAVFGGLAFLFLRLLGFFAFIAAFLAGPAAGGLVAEAARQVVGKRRGLHMRVIVMACAAGGVLFSGLLLSLGPALLVGVPLAQIGAVALRVLLRLDVLLFSVLMLSAIYARLQ